MIVNLPTPLHAPEARESYLSLHTLAAHCGYHRTAYEAKTRALIQGTPSESASPDEIGRFSAEHDRTLFDAAAQMWNHWFYWTSMHPGCPAGGRNDSN